MQTPLLIFPSGVWNMSQQEHLFGLGGTDVCSVRAKCMSYYHWVKHCTGTIVVWLSQVSTLPDGFLSKLQTFFIIMWPQFETSVAVFVSEVWIQSRQQCVCVCVWPVFLSNRPRWYPKGRLNSKILWSNLFSIFCFLRSSFGRKLPTCHTVDCTFYFLFLTVLVFHHQIFHSVRTPLCLFILCLNLRCNVSRISSTPRSTGSFPESNLETDSFCWGRLNSSEYLSPFFKCVNSLGKGEIICQG